MDLKKKKNDLTSGYYHVWMNSTKREKIKVFCDMETGGGILKYYFFILGIIMQPPYFRSS